MQTNKSEIRRYTYISTFHKFKMPKTTKLFGSHLGNRELDISY